MTIGGFFSRGLKIDFIGVPLLILGAKQCGKRINQLVEHTKKQQHLQINKFSFYKINSFK